MYFTQSAMYLGDIPVAAFGVITVYFGLHRKYFLYLITSLCLVMLKETGAVIVSAFLIYLFITEIKEKQNLFKKILKYGLPLWLFASFLVWQKLTTGKFVGIYSFEFDVYNESVEAAVMDFLAALNWVFIEQYRFVLLAFIVAGFFISKKKFFKKELILFGLITLFIAFTFSFFFFLPRYILPVLPYLCITAAFSISVLIKSKRLQTLTGLSVTIIFLLFLFNQPSFGNNEWNMRYVHHVNMYKKMCSYIEENFPDASVLTVFPYKSSLSQSYLGYVDKPVKAINFDKIFYEDEFDVILYSEPVISANESMLKKYAAENKMLLIKEVKAEGITSKLFVKNNAPEDEL